MESIDDQVALLNKCMSEYNITFVIRSLLKQVAAKANARGTKSDEDMFHILSEQELLWHRIVAIVQVQGIIKPDLFREAVLVVMPAVHPGWMSYIHKGNGK